jgi:hypothetical protein
VGGELVGLVEDRQIPTGGAKGDSFGLPPSSPGSTHSTVGRLDLAALSPLW